MSRFCLERLRLRMLRSRLEDALQRLGRQGRPVAEALEPAPELAADLAEVRTLLRLDNPRTAEAAYDRFCADLVLAARGAEGLPGAALAADGFAADGDGPGADGGGAPETQPGL